MVIHAGSERNAEEREMWKVFYRGVPKVCFRCLGRDCRDNLVSLEELASQACYEEAPAGPKDDSDDEQELAPITFAQIVKETNFTQKREARKKFAEQKQKEKVVQERVLEERRDRQRKEGRKDSVLVEEVALRERSPQIGQQTLGKIPCFKLGPKKPRDIWLKT